MRRGGSAIDGRTTRHPGYLISQRKRKRVEEVFLVEDCRVVAQDAPPWLAVGELDLPVCYCGLQLGKN